MQYFHCEDKCGLFVSLNELFPAPPTKVFLRRAKAEGTVSKHHSGEMSTPPCSRGQSKGESSPPLIMLLPSKQIKVVPLHHAFCLKGILQRLVLMLSWVSGCLFMISMARSTMVLSIGLERRIVVANLTTLWLELKL